MSIRQEILKTIEAGETVGVSKPHLFNSISADNRKIEAALGDLQSEGVVDSVKIMTTDYFFISSDVDDIADVEDSAGVGEIAEAIMQKSPQFGDETEHDKDVSKLWKAISEK